MKVLALALLAVSSPFIAHSATRPADADLPGTYADAAKAPDLKKFLISTKGSYGWQPLKGDISFDFFPTGGLHVQGPDGEATMWQGKWSLKGDQLTITYNGKKKTMKAAVEGDLLVLDGQKYKRYKPE